MGRPTPRLNKSRFPATIGRGIDLRAAGGVTLLVGAALLLSGLQPRSGRVVVYLLYMLWLAIIMPGLFSLMSGRDDRHAALAYALLAFFNFGTTLSMMERELAGPWVAPA